MPTSGISGVLIHDLAIKECCLKLCCRKTSIIKQLGWITQSRFFSFLLCSHVFSNEQGILQSENIQSKLFFEERWLLCKQCNSLMGFFISVCFCFFFFFLLEKMPENTQRGAETWGWLECVHGRAPERRAESQAQKGEEVTYF